MWFYDPDEYARRQDEERLRRLQAVTTPVHAAIVSGRLNLREALMLVDDARSQAAVIVPDKMETYDLIHGARFVRLIQQWILQPNGGGPPLE